MCEVLEHLAEPEAVLGDAVALVREGGQFILTCPHDNSIPDPERKFVVLSKVDKVKFKKMVTPGDQLRMEVALVRVKGRIWHMRGRAFVGQELATEGEMYATMLDRDELAELM